MQSKSSLLVFLKAILLLLLLGMRWAEVYAQSSRSSLRCRTHATDLRPWVLADSLMIDPRSIALRPALPFAYEKKTQTIALDSVVANGKAVEVCYRVLPVGAAKTKAFHAPIALYDSTTFFRPLSVSNPLKRRKDELFATPQIYKTGSLSRAVSFGNSQSLNVLSAFNFQMEGRLSDRLNIRADLTDQNIPFQPEGNTQQLREFDHVSLEVYNEKLSFKAGDLALTHAPSYFLKYYKNVQGGQFDIAYRLGKQNQAKTSLALGAAKGQFADLSLKPVEGVQGPYRIPGPHGQPFVVILANSERVYVDGKPMQRGYNHDYVINYNLGEITFNPTVPITQFSRMRITFEYSDQNYNRSVTRVNQSIKMGNTTAKLGFYREQDDKNKPLRFSLSPNDKRRISEAMDTQQLVPIAAEQLTPYNPRLVLYEKRDTTVNTQMYGMLVHSKDSTKALYQVVFSRVGTGKGDYKRLNSATNGDVYHWLPPVLGVKQGSFAPVRLVAAPNAKQLITLGVDTRYGQYFTAFADLAFSDQDLNLYARKKNKERQDIAYRVGLTLVDMPVKGVPKYSLSAGLSYEYDGARFQPIDRYRPIEYNRDWGCDSAKDSVRSAEHIVNASWALGKDARNALSSRFSFRKKQAVIHGFQWESTLKKSIGAIQVNGEQFYMKNEAGASKTEWRRWIGETYYDRFFVVPGYRFEDDRNEVRSAQNDALEKTTLHYTSHQFYLHNQDSLRVNFRLSHTLREDRQVHKEWLVPYAHTHTTAAQASTYLNPSNRIDLTFTYRKVGYTAELKDRKNENALLGRLNWQGTLLNKHVRTDLSYATSGSREMLRTFVFRKVNTGEGTHAWRDLNGNGLQENHEFFPAINFDEKQYIKVFVPTTDFVHAYQTTFVLATHVQMPRSWRDAAGLSRLLSQISNRTSLNINKKNTHSDFNARFNPFALSLADGNLIFVRKVIRTVFFFNPSGRGMGGDVGYQTNSAKQLISSGMTSLWSEKYTLNLRYHINSAWTLTGHVAEEQKKNTSPWQGTNDYHIRSREALPGIVWQPKNNLRLSLNYRIAHKKNEEKAESGAQAQLNATQLEARWSKGISNTLTAHFQLTNILFTGERNTAMAYEMLEALQPGANYSWRLNYAQKLFSGLQLSVGYEGRKSNQSAVIHRGRVQVTALF